MKVTLSSFNVGDLKMIVVYLRGSEWYGSGGCGMLVLEESGSSYKVIGDETVVQLPIRLGDHTSHGMPDLIVHVQGGGLIKAMMQNSLSTEDPIQTIQPCLQHAN
jgi:hypothetical protein